MLAYDVILRARDFLLKGRGFHPRRPIELRRGF
jgi:hypothetical protein